MLAFCFFFRGPIWATMSSTMCRATNKTGHLGSALFLPWPGLPTVAAQNDGFPMPFAVTSLSSPLESNHSSPVHSTGQHLPDCRDSIKCDGYSAGKARRVRRRGGNEKEGEKCMKLKLADLI